MGAIGFSFWSPLGHYSSAVIPMTSVSGFLARTGALPLCTPLLTLASCHRGKTLNPWVFYHSCHHLSHSHSDLGLGHRAKPLTVGSLGWIWSDFRVPKLFLSIFFTDIIFYHNGKIVMKSLVDVSRVLNLGF